MELWTGRSKYISLKELQYPPSTILTNRPILYTQSVYGKSVQYTSMEEDKIMNNKEIRHVQEVCDKFIYLARTVENILMHALNELCITATKGTEETAKALAHFLNYYASNSDV